jgi:hypothetical protein
MIKKKAILATLAIVSLGIPFIAVAKPEICPYTDHFFIRTDRSTSEVDPFVSILSASTICF